MSRLIGKGEREDLFGKIGNPHSLFTKKDIRGLSFVLMLFILLVIIGVLLRLKPTGFVIVKGEFNYTDSVSLLVNESYEYIWVMGNYGLLKSLRLDGSLSKEGIARVYLEHESKSYLIFDSSRLGGEGISGVTGLMVGDESSNNSINEEIDDNTTSAQLGGNKSIIIRADGGGRKPLDEVFEFNVSSLFNWGVDYSKLCTKWDVNLVDICYGAVDCCAFIGLESLGSWNDSFYLSYGRYDSRISNVVKAQVIYANYSLSVDNPYSDIVYSNGYSLDADFYEEMSEFSNFCADSCLLPSLNLSSYRLRIEVEKGRLLIDNIRYSVEMEINVSQHAPTLVKDIENITVYRNEEYMIDLSSYFADEDNDILNYSAYLAENISAFIDGSIARIIPDSGFIGTRYMFFRADDGYYSVVSNVFRIDVIESVSGEVKPSVVVNEPVKWVRREKAGGVVNYSVNIPSYALNVSVRDIREDRMISTDKIKIRDRGVLKTVPSFMAEKRIGQIDKIISRLEKRKLKRVKEGADDEISGLLLEKNRLGDYVTAGEIRDNATSVIIEDIVEDVEIEYYTEGAYSEEENIRRGKRIVISSDVHYEDILAYTYLDDVQKSRIRLYHVTDGSRELVNNIGYYDENNNSLIDRIEWVVPSLSNETYEVIIITKAEHLDENRTFIEDVYEYVKEKDDNWTIIPNEHYVRVTFEQLLDKTKDITIYARSAGNSTAEIEVYRENDTGLIAAFENINEEREYKAYLINLSENESYDVFDLKVIGENGVEIDYIVDPTITSLQAATDSLLIDVIAETGQANFTHLNISNDDPWDNLVAYWPFDMDRTGNGNTVYDYTENNFDGTLLDPAIINNSGIIGNALVVNGVDDNSNGVNITTDSDGSNLDITGTITVMAWVTKNSASLGDNHAVIFARGATSAADNAMQYQLNSADTVGPSIKFLVSEGTITLQSRSPGGKMQYDKWYHVAGTYDGVRTTKFFLNGTQVDSDIDDTIGTLNSVDTGTAIGGDAANNRLYWNGAIDEVMVFNTNLSEAQITAIYNNQSARFKATGKQQLTNQTYLNITTGNNRINITTDFKNLLGSQINLSIGYYDGSWSNTKAQNLTPRQIHTFNISSTSTNLTLNYTFIAGTDQFYTPILNGSIVFDVWNSPSPSSRRFIITNASGSNTASLDDKGNMYLKGSASASQSSLTPTPNSFIIQNSTRDTIAYINSTGHLFLIGTITAKSDLSDRTDTNFEFRNASNDIIAFFDNKGNLKLKGVVGENYDNP